MSSVLKKADKLNLSLSLQASYIHVWDLNMVFSVSVAIIEPNSAKPSAGTMLTAVLDIIF